MDTSNKFTIIKKGVFISVVIAILFTCGFILGAVMSTVDAIEVDQTPESTTVVTTTQAPTTAAPETTVPTTVPTTAAPETTVPTTAAPETTSPSTDSATTTTAPSSNDGSTTSSGATDTPDGETEKEPGLLIRIFIGILEFAKKIIDFVLSILTSL